MSICKSTCIHFRGMLTCHRAGYDGFIQVLCKKQTIYKDVLAELKSRLEKIKWRTRYKAHD